MRMMRNGDEEDENEDEEDEEGEESQLLGREGGSIGTKFPPPPKKRGGAFPKIQPLLVAACIP